MILISLVQVVVTGSSLRIVETFRRNQLCLSEVPDNEFDSLAVVLEIFDASPRTYQETLSALQLQRRKE